MNARAFTVAALVLASGPAAAQEKPAGNDCQNVDPIAGSARLTLFPYAEGHFAFDYGIGGGF